MPHRKIETIETELKFVEEAEQRIFDEKAVKLRKAKEKIDAEYADQLRRIEADEILLRDELERAKAAAASHPLEGMLVYREDSKNVMAGSGFFGKKVIKQRGVVTVVRSSADLPPRKKNVGWQDRPEIGETIIQRVSARGEKLTGWRRIPEGKILPEGWAQEEESE